MTKPSHAKVIHTESVPRTLLTALAPLNAIFSLAVFAGAASCRTPVSPLELPKRDRASTRLVSGPFMRTIVAGWTDEKQRALERDAKEGLAVVSASGTGITLLPDCQLEGHYRYFAITPQHQRHLIKDEAEARANLALDPALAPPRTPLTLDVILVGRLATTRRAAQGAKLVGSCAGATHFARTLSVGEVVTNSGGSAPPLRCLTATVDDVLPPPGCRRFLGAELVALSDAKFDTTSDTIRFCPSGWALADDLCVEVRPGIVYECADDNPKDCQAQCDRGNAASCTRLGFLAAHGSAGFHQDDRRALELYNRACTAGYPPACFNIGVLYSLEGTVQKDDGTAERFWHRACSDGYPAACSNLGLLYERSESVPHDEDRALSFFSRACAGGDPIGCMNALVLVRRQRKASSDQDIGLFLRLACDGDVSTACFDLADWLNGHGADPGATRKLLEQACRLGLKRACKSTLQTEEL